MKYSPKSNMATESEYRSLQKSFISNLNGTSAMEISLITSSSPLSVLLRSLLWQILAGNRETLHGIFPTSVIFFFEYITLILPTLLVFTMLADYAAIFILLALAGTGLFLLRSLTQNKTLSVPIHYKKKLFLCTFRVYVNVATAISILAVDFPIYPRRFAKTETFGTGLMDVGVGSFMMANAVVSPDARGGTSTLLFMKALKIEFRAVLVLLVLGLVRFAAVKMTDYQEHVSEYGVHWNFFLTLACVRLLSTIILRTLPEFLGKKPWIIGIIIGLWYQRALENGLEDFILNGSMGDGSRSNFIDANREGLGSSFGYVALYFVGISIGKLIFHNKYDCIRSLVQMFASLMFIAVLAWSTLWYWGDMRSPERLVSRRLANFPFVLWQLGFNVQLLALFLAVEILMIMLSSTPQTFLRYPGWCASCSSENTSNKHAISSTSSPNFNLAPTEDSFQDSPGRLRHPKAESISQSTKTNSLKEKNCVPLRCSCLISSINYNLLAYFLIANLLTGAVNLSINTINTPPITAFIIMNVYLLLLHAMITVFYRRKILLKL